MSCAVLVIEDEEILGKNVSSYLTRYGYDIKVAGSGEEGLAEFESFRPEAVVLDFNLPGMTGLEVLKEMRKRDSHVKIVMVTGHGSEQVAVDAMKAGAYDYLSKPLVLGKLKLVLEKALGEERIAEELSYYRKKEASEGGLARLIGESPPMTALKALIKQLMEAEGKLADAEPPAVLITGDTGTGKELVARALHFEGPRQRRPFVEVNCSSIPANLLEAELFGYERGAFTDAKERKLGLIEAADGGTLFLDEIGEIELALQVKLLKLLEDKIVRRLGNVREHKVDVRIVAATNRNLEQQVREGKFRSDLFFRLRMIHLETPALCERGDDVNLLAQQFLHMHAGRYGKPQLRFTAQALAALRSYSWPGNVRELKNIIEQCVIMARGSEIGPSDLMFSTRLGTNTRVAREEKFDVEPRPGDANIAIPQQGLNFNAVERGLLLQALEQTGWNVSKAARLLGLSRDTVRYRIDKFDLKLPS
jgi:two-component system, NtrC family, response regulator AtoC